MIYVCTEENDMRDELDDRDDTLQLNRNNNGDEEDEDEKKGGVRIR